MGATHAMPIYSATDLERSFAWYTDTLGCDVLQKWEENGVMVGASLKYGEVIIGLSQDDFKKGRDRQKGEGFRLLFETQEDVDELAAGIQKRGGELLSGPQDQPWGTRDFAVADPDGFKISISSPMPKE